VADDIGVFKGHPILDGVDGVSGHKEQAAPLHLGADNTEHLLCEIRASLVVRPPQYDWPRALRTDVPQLLELLLLLLGHRPQLALEVLRTIRGRTGANTGLGVRGSIQPDQPTNQST
jgi:hypothetical protein